MTIAPQPEKLTPFGLAPGALVPVCKVDRRLGLVFGWGVICTKNGEPFYDHDNQHIPEDVMLEMASEFMAGPRVAGDLHERTANYNEGGDPVAHGTNLFAFPMTAELAKNLGIQTEFTGLLIGMRPSAEVLKKFEDGTYTGFSIGGAAEWVDA